MCPHNWQSTQYLLLNYDMPKENPRSVNRPFSFPLTITLTQHIGMSSGAMKLTPFNFKLLYPYFLLLGVNRLVYKENAEICKQQSTTSPPQQLGNFREYLSLMEPDSSLRDSLERLE